MLTLLLHAVSSAIVVGLLVGFADLLSTPFDGARDTASIAWLSLGLHLAVSAVGGALAAAAVLVLGAPFPVLVRELLRPLRAHRLQRSAELLVWPVVLGATFVVLTLLGRRFFAFNNTGLAALLLAALSLGASLAAARVARRASAAAARRLEGMDLAWLSPTTVALAWAGLATGGALAVALRRGAALAETWEALELGLVGCLGATLVGGLVFAGVGPARLRHATFALAAAGLVVAAIGLGRGAKITGEDNAWVHASPLWARATFGAAERLVDADRDGFSAWLGHGDCNDANPDAFPGSTSGDDCLPDEPLEDRDAFVARLRGSAPPVAVAPPGRPGAPVAPAAKAPLPGRPAQPEVPEGTPPVIAPLPGRAVPAEVPGAPPVPPAVEPAPARRPYAVVLVTLDTVRADHVSFLGYERKTTPNLDRLAEQSLVFERAYAPSNMTPISMGAMLSGRYTSELFRDDSHFIRFDDSNTFLAERLKDAGVESAAVVTHWYFEKKKGSGLDQGFGDWKVAGTQWGKEMEDVATSHLVTDQALETLNGLPVDRPWFLWVHYLDPHKWYIHHEGFEPRFGNSNKDRYDHEIAFTDHHVGRLLDALGKRADAGHIAVIATSDHGEAFGEHGTAFHGFSVYEDQLRVPLVVRAPGLTDRGFRLGKRVSLIDVTPTILDLTGAGLPANELQGQSWRPELEGREVPQRLIYAERVRGPHSAGYRTLIDGDWKIVWRAAGNRHELYDLAKDPKELADLAESNPDTAKRMRSALASMVEFGLDLEGKVRKGR